MILVAIWHESNTGLKTPHFRSRINQITSEANYVTSIPKIKTRFACSPDSNRDSKTHQNLRNSWAFWPTQQKMICGAKTRAGGTCQKHGMFNGRCRLHGGLSPKGQDHWNYQHGWCTKESRQRSVETNAYINLLEHLAISLGMIETKR